MVLESLNIVLRSNDVWKEISVEDATDLWELGIPVYYHWAGVSWLTYPKKSKSFTNSPKGHSDYRVYSNIPPTRFRVQVE